MYISLIQSYIESLEQNQLYTKCKNLIENYDPNNFSILLIYEFITSYMTLNQQLIDHLHYANINDFIFAFITFHLPFNFNQHLVLKEQIYLLSNIFKNTFLLDNINRKRKTTIRKFIF